MEAALFELLQQAKEAGTKASLIFKTVGGKMEAKFEVELVFSGPATGSPSPTGTTTLLQEEIVANADVDAIVDRQLWLNLKQEQRLTRPPSDNWMAKVTASWTRRRREKARGRSMEGSIAYSAMSYPSPNLWSLSPSTPSTTTEPS